MPDTFCIKDGYRAQPRAATFETAPGSYWTPWRIDQTMQYQHDVYRLSKELAEREGFETIADVGCGVAAKLHHFFQWYSPVGFDQPTVEAVAKQLSPSVSFRPIDLEMPGLIDEKFDLVICADVVEHLLNPDPCMAFLHGITAGLCVISTPERDIIRGPECMASEKPEHVREWNREEFAAFLESRGFEIVEHLLLPQARLTKAEWAEREASDKITRAWHGCQYVVCRPRH